MKPLKMQPTFRLEAPGRVDDVVQELRRAIGSPGLEGLVENSGKCFDFKIEPADRRFWSPHLSVMLGQAETDGGPVTEIFGRFSPRPEVWTMVIMLYFGAATMVVFALVYGGVRWSLGMPAWSLALAPAGLLAIAALHAASLIGQRLSADQMHLLRSRFDQVYNLAIGDAPPGHDN